MSKKEEKEKKDHPSPQISAVFTLEVVVFFREEAVHWNLASQRPAGSLSRIGREMARSPLLLQGEILGQWCSTGRGEPPILEAAS